MPVYTDQLQRQVSIPYLPRRLVSLVPSQTELLFTLGLDEAVVGLTKFCVHPPQWHQTKMRVGGTKNINLEKLRSLRPDLIIANKEENTKASIEELAAEFPVWVSDVNRLDEALSMIRQVGKIAAREDSAEALANRIQVAFNQLSKPVQPVSVAYLIWQDPFMTVGGDTFINDLLQRSGFENVFADRLRYPVVTLDELRASRCEVVFLSSEPYPFQLKHREALQRELPGTTVLLVDGEPFSWYGSRLLLAPAYFQKLQAQIGWVQ